MGHCGPFYFAGSDVDDRREAGGGELVYTYSDCDAPCGFDLDLGLSLDPNPAAAIWSDLNPPDYTTTATTPTSKPPADCAESGWGLWVQDGLYPSNVSADHGHAPSVGGHSVPLSRGASMDSATTTYPSTPSDYSLGPASPTDPSFDPAESILEAATAATSPRDRFLQGASLVVDSLYDSTPCPYLSPRNLYSYPPESSCPAYGASSTPRSMLPQRHDPSQASSDGDGVVCLFPGCTVKPFRRKADLDRHYQRLHGRLAKDFPCDYPACARSTEPFGRLDHYRDHLRSYHNEDIIKRNMTGAAAGDSITEGGQAQQQQHLQSYNIVWWWWRCNKCMSRVKIKDHGWKCPKDQTTCHEFGRKAREKMAAKRKRDFDDR